MQYQRKPVVLSAGEGRSYEMGSMRAVFKADETETSNAYSISEWWLEPETTGPGKHKHQEDDIFFVIQGTMSFYVQDKWIDAKQGSFILVPGGIEHDFENRGKEKAGVLNISAPGGFEQNMPMIVDWFRKNPPGKTEK